MNTIGRPDIESVLAQMRSLQQAAQGRELLQATEVPESDSLQKTDSTGFGELLKSAVDSVNEVQQEAGQLSNAFMRGETQDLVKVMVSLQKANIGFQAMVQVRNRMVSAYQDIMNMPI